jgi:alkaline phosphatase
MAAKALDILDNDADGLFLMVEGGRIDHAGHSNDLVRNIYETIEFAYAAEVVLDWALDNPDTLIIVTADHETGGLSVLANNGQGNLPTVSWSTTSHTDENVPIYAWGVNSDLVSGIMDNTDIFEIATVPEPATFLLVALGCLVFRRYKTQ